MKILLIPILAGACLGETVPLKFVSLFNGKDLAGWHGEGYAVEDGNIVCTPDGRNLVTNATFASYVFDLDFKLPPGANNGLGIHYPGTGDPAFTGMELQILDNSDGRYKDLQPYQFQSSLYSILPAKQGALKPAGEWNIQRVIITGPRIQVNLNGTDVLDANLDELQKQHPEHEGLKRRSGHIAFAGHGDKVTFRNPRIAEFPPPANVEAVKAAGFTPLFDGSTLAGWKVDPGAEGHWIPINGILKYDGRSEAENKDLWTLEEYGDFTLVFDWRWAGDGPLMQRPLIAADGSETGETVEVQELDSGIYLRGDSKSQVNLWNWPVGSGEVYGYRTDASQPAEVRAGVTPKSKADRPVGEWNRMMITMKGDRLSVVLNGVSVIEDAALPGVAAKGRLALQHHGSPIDFANMWIKKL